MKQKKPTPAQFQQILTNVFMKKKKEKNWVDPIPPPYKEAKIEYPEVFVHRGSIDSIITEVKACKLILSNLNKELKYPKPMHIKDLRDEFSTILNQLKELRKGIK